ncbi:hypothetical protein [Jatrophihabitans sp.]|uniref:hypothetical protein n=1 Tax=Jatrophihabitans sp. TaxID=1932789 RepID=UPI0030C77B1D|nr:hypothetical protein [Jatrophihabitans sp.]
MDKYIDLTALGKVLLASAIAGIGLVAVFGVGLVGVARWEGATSATGEDQEADRSGRAGWLAGAGLCFAVVLLGVAIGIYSIVDK